MLQDEQRVQICGRGLIKTSFSYLMRDSSLLMNTRKWFLPSLTPEKHQETFQERPGHRIVFKQSSIHRDSTADKNKFPFKLFLTVRHWINLNSRYDLLKTNIIKTNYALTRDLEGLLVLHPF